MEFELDLDALQLLRGDEARLARDISPNCTITCTNSCDSTCTVSCLNTG